MTEDLRTWRRIKSRSWPNISPESVDIGIPGHSLPRPHHGNQEYRFILPISQPDVGVSGSPGSGLYLTRGGEIISPALSYMHE